MCFIVQACKYFYFRLEGIQFDFFLDKNVLVPGPLLISLHTIGTEVLLKSTERTTILKFSLPHVSLNKFRFGVQRRAL